MGIGRSQRGATTASVWSFLVLPVFVCVVAASRAFFFPPHLALLRRRRIGLDGGRGEGPTLSIDGSGPGAL